MILLTGGAGFIGSAMLRALNDLGLDRVLVVDDLGSSEKWKNLAGKHFLDYLDKNVLLEQLRAGKLPKKFEAVIHLGACSSTTETDADYMIENNYRYTRELAEWALRNEVRFIYASSAATYGDGGLGFSDADETTLRLKPLNVYAFSKQLLDLWAIRTGAVKKITGVKFFNVFGPNEYHKGDMTSVVYKAVQQIRESGKLKLFKSYKDEYADGEQKRDFVYVKDCVAVLSWFLEQPAATGIFNLGTGQARSWNDLAKAVFAAMDLPAQIEYIEMPETLRTKYQYFTEAQMDKLRLAGCSTQFRPLADAVDDYVRNYLRSELTCW